MRTNSYYAPESSFIDHKSNELAALEAQREEARESMALILADGGIVLFDDGDSLKLTDEMIDSFIRREKGGY